jgi:crotonobetainyl-CoA:carnitine CoA-transferase CaiB-like acyl-CoA transferase
MAPPLEGVRVLDLSLGLPGAYCTKLLADAGADVVKVEPAGGDPFRRWSASGARLDGEDGALFRFLSAGKRSAVLDLDFELDRTSTVALADRADIIVESFGAGRVRDRSRGMLRDRNARAVLVSISSFGLSGPWASLPATEFTLQAACGSTGFRGFPDGPPVAVGGRVGEWATGTFAALGALCAYRRARPGGLGEHVDVSMLECMTIALASCEWVHASLMGTEDYFARATECPSIEPARDGYVCFTVYTPQQWRDFTAMIGREDLADEQELWSVLGRWPRREELWEPIRKWSRERTVNEILDAAAAHHVPAAPLGTGATVPANEHFSTRGLFARDPGGGFIRPRSPFRLSRSPLREPGPAPRLGEHTDEIMREWTADRRREPGATEGAAPLPLAGLRIIDLTAYWAGPMAAAWLGTMGADVVKVESIQRPDGIRFYSVKAPGTERWWEYSWVFNAANPNKRGVTLDLSREEGREVLRRLIASCDGVVHGLAPRVMQKLGLTAEDIAALNPRAIVLAMPAFGLEGPWRDRPGFAQTMESVSGLAYLTGFADGAPIIPRGPCDPLAGAHGAFAFLLALEHRDRTGEGQLVEAPMVEVALNVAAEQVIEHSAYGVLLERDGNRGPAAAPQNLYRCAGDDEWIAIAVETDDQWAALREILGNPAWARDESLANQAGRRAAHDAIDVELAKWCAKREASSTADELLVAGIAAAQVEFPPHVSRNPQMRSRGFFEDVSHPIAGTHPLAAVPMRFSNGPERWLRRPAPSIGEHNDEVLRDEMGLSRDEIERLRGEGVIGNAPVGF